MENNLENLTIGVFARTAGVNVETIRFYQRKGLLPEPDKPYGSIRRYGETDVTRVRFVKSAQRLGFRPLARRGSALTTASAERRSPITPVEAIMTCVRGQPSVSATPAAALATVSAPARPVKTLALPALTRSARARPLGSCLRHQSTGAPGMLLRVRTPATVVPGAKRAISMSGRPV